VTRSTKIHVTDHAIVRYLERACDFDIEEIRKLITDLVQPAAAVGASTLTVKGLRFCFVEHANKNIQVTTVMDADMAVNYKLTRNRSGEKKSTFREELEKRRHEHKIRNRRK
jgi:hypothetical protein